MRETRIAIVRSGTTEPVVLNDQAKTVLIFNNEIQAFKVLKRLRASAPTIGFELYPLPLEDTSGH